MPYGPGQLKIWATEVQTSGLNVIRNGGKNDPTGYNEVLRLFGRNINTGRNFLLEAKHYTLRNA